VGCECGWCVSLTSPRSFLSGSTVTSPPLALAFLVTSPLRRRQCTATGSCGRSTAGRRHRTKAVDLITLAETEYGRMRRKLTKLCCVRNKFSAGRKSRWKAYIVDCLPPPPPPLSAFAARCVAAAARPRDGRVRCMTAVKEACWNRGTRYDERWQISRSPKTGVLAYGVKRVKRDLCAMYGDTRPHTKLSFWVFYVAF
jgi:hypothetical protein